MYLVDAAYQCNRGSANLVRLTSALAALNDANNVDAAAGGEAVYIVG